MPNNRRLFTTQEAAARIGFSDARLRQLIAVGIAKPKEQLGGTWLFTPKEIERLISRRKAGRAGKR